MADNQVVSIGFGPGLDTKTDPKVAAKPILIQDGIFTSPHRISKRNGYDQLPMTILSGGTISNPTMVRSYRNELLCSGTSSVTGLRLFSYSSTLSAWVDKGKYTSFKVSKKTVSAIQTGSVTALPTINLGATNSSAAYLNGISAYAYDADISDHTTATASAVYFNIQDETTGSIISDQATIVSSGTTFGFSRMVALGSTCFAIFYVSNISGTKKLCFKTITVSGSGVVIGSEVVLNNIGTGSGLFNYDVQSTPSGAFVSLVSGTSIVIYTINTSGSTTHTTTISAGGAVTPISIQSDASTGTNAWVYWVESDTTLKYAIYNSSTLASVLANTQIFTGGANFNQICALSTSSTGQTVFWSNVTQPLLSTSTIGVYSPQIGMQTVTTTGPTGGQQVFKPGVNIYGKPFSVNGFSYIPCMAISQTNPIGLLLDLSDGAAVAKFLVGEAEGVYKQGGNLSGSSYVQPQIISFRWPSFPISAYSLSSTKISFAAGVVISLSTLVNSSGTNLSAFPVLSAEGVQMGVAGVTIDLSHIDSYQSVIQQDTLIMNGGVVSQYDSAGVTELGYTIDPDQVSAIATNVGGQLGIGKYIYYVVFQWTDANGNLHQSAPSQPVEAVFSSGTTNSVTIYWGSPTVTQKVNVITNVYRTTANGTIAYLIGSSTNNASSYLGNIFVDDISNSSDSQIINYPEIYTVGGSVLENIAPPPSMIIWTNNNRAWCVDSENPETTLEYSKTASAGSGVSFSMGLLEYLVDSKNGEITGASPMDEKTVILKSGGVGYFIGDGANDSGGGSTLTNFQFVPSDTGCSNSKSVILYPDGVLFRSSNNKGVYRVNRGTQVSYFGMDVEAYNSQDIRSAFIVPNRNQIRFLTSSGSSLLYDYVMGQWSVFTNHDGYSADQYTGLYVYVRTDGSIYLEDQTSFLDNASSYPLYVKLQWIKSSSVQNFQRLRRVMMLGDYQNGSSQAHGVQISAAYDFGTSFSNAVSYLFGQSSSSGYFQYRERLEQQKCDSVQLVIQEIVTGASGEYVDFTDLGLEISTKRGLNKLPQYRSVG